MKKVLAVLFGASLAAPAVAGVGFGYGAVFFFPRYDTQGAAEDFSGQGQMFSVDWSLDNGLSVGVFSEATTLVEVDDGYTYNFAAQGIQIQKTIVKGGEIGMHLGSFYEDFNDKGALLADLYGSVTLISGNSDKVGGAIKANVGGRLANDTGGTSVYGSDFSGYFLTLIVAIGI
jgi:hypothetical protein